MKLRAVDPADLPALDALALAAKASHGYPPALLSRWAADLRTAPDSLEDQPAWLLEDAGVALGFCQVDPRRSPWRLVSLFVAPGWQRRGPQACCGGCGGCAGRCGWGRSGRHGGG